MRLIWRWIRFAWESIPRTPRRGGGISVWLFNWWQQRFTGPGKVMLVVWITLGLVEMIPGASAATIPLVLFSVAYFVTWLLTLVSPGLEASWIFPHAIRQGEVFVLRITVRNVGRRRIRDAGAWLFWEEKWMRPIGEPRSVDALEPGESAQIEVPVLAYSRGPCKLRGPVVYRVDPLGIMRSRRRVDSAVIPVIRPRSNSVQEFPFLSEGGSGMEFARLLHPTHGRSSEFIGIREYRSGDEFRDIHHKAWARAGKPITREYGKEKGQGAIMIVETGCASFLERSVVENMLCWSIGIAKWLFDRGALGRFFIDSHEISIEGHGDVLDVIEDALARIPRPLWWAWQSPEPWEPEARPMGPVFAIGCSRSRAESWLGGNGLLGMDALIAKRVLILPEELSGWHQRRDPSSRMLYLSQSGAPK